MGLKGTSDEYDALARRVGLPTAEEAQARADAAPDEPPLFGDFPNGGDDEIVVFFLDDEEDQIGYCDEAHEVEEGQREFYVYPGVPHSGGSYTLSSAEVRRATKAEVWQWFKRLHPEQ